MERGAGRPGSRHMGERRRPLRLLTRADFLAGAGAAAALACGRPASILRAAERSMQTRLIPSSGVPLPVVGLGTWQTFDVGPSPRERAPLTEVLRTLFAGGGSVIDSSPMYGRAEGVVGDLLAADGARGGAFLATKVWTRGRADGIAQMDRSLALLRVDRIDLMQVHNLLDWRVH